MNPRFNLSLLLDMLTYARPAKGDTVNTFCDRFIRPLPGAVQDAFRNWHVRIGDGPVLWSCHTDTVHRIDGRQTLHYDATLDMVQLSKRSKAIMHCLGADDTAGVFLLVSMINERIPGHYIFHHAEEIGGIGSDAIADHTPEMLAGVQFAIALDRKGTADVITHQFGRCCSDTFAESLAAQLNRVDGLKYAPCTSGVFTDTANYTGLIAECTNLSVGYYDAHSDRECLDVTHLRTLLVALCQLDQTALVAERSAGDVDEYEWQDRWVTLPERKPLAFAKPTRDDIAVAKDRYGVDVDVDAECYACGYWYVQADSTAEESDVYCCQECEHYDLNVRALEQADGRGVFLDPDYEDIQDALNEARIALQANRLHRIH